MTSNTKTNPSRVRLLIVGIVFVLSYCSWQLYLWMLRNEPLDSAARNILNAYHANDVGTLWFYSFSGEKEAYPLNEKQFAALFTNYVRPSLQSLKKKRFIGDYIYSGQQYGATQFYEVNGRELFLDIVVLKTRNGPKTFVVGPAILLAMSQRHGDSFLSSSYRMQTWGPLADGILKDKERLKSFGITGYVDMPPGSAIKSWTKVERMFRIKSGELPMPVRGN